MPPPHLTVLNVRDEDEEAEERSLWRMRMGFGPPKPRATPASAPRPPAAEKPRRASREAQRVLTTPRLHIPVPGPSRLPVPTPMPVPAVTPPLVEAAENLAPPPVAVADFPPVPETASRTMAPAQHTRPSDDTPPGIPIGAAARAYEMGRRGERPKHAMSAIELSAWQDGAMEAGRGRDPIFGRPTAWWWISLAALLVLPLTYAAAWAGLPGTAADFLMTPLGQEAWIALGGPSAAVFYWGGLFLLGLVLQLARPLEPVLIVFTATWWGWMGLHLASAAGWLAQHIPPPPLPG